MINLWYDLLGRLRPSLFWFHQKEDGATAPVHRAQQSLCDWLGRSSTLYHSTEDYTPNVRSIVGCCKTLNSRVRRSKNGGTSKEKRIWSFVVRRGPEIVACFMESRAYLFGESFLLNFQPLTRRFSTAGRFEHVSWVRIISLLSRTRIRLQCCLWPCTPAFTGSRVVVKLKRNSIAHTY